MRLMNSPRLAILSRNHFVYVPRAFNVDSRLMLNSRSQAHDSSGASRLPWSSILGSIPKSKGRSITIDPGHPHIWMILTWVHPESGDRPWILAWNARQIKTMPKWTISSSF